ncbi:DUF2752 domain-containing protein [Robertkochia aurantiaca]|uniref:DUF2752 domain-containing protein n=1 Tax=Robertkochia aurantiaca TaxID=2873700 RepID=UPI001CCB0B5C|nr:DUF2752 domain-containing protein [Robertkochia sp. 3YJGBD-33]
MFYTADITMEDFMLPCLNKKFFGVECMGCGLQRSAALLIRGEFTAAFHMYPAIYTLILLFAFLVINHFYRLRSGNRILVILLVVNGIVIIGNYILKLINF